MSNYDNWKFGLDEPDNPDCHYCFDFGCNICENYPNITCIHNAELGLTMMCEQCRKDYDIDDASWMEFGPHKQGIENWNKHLEEMEEYYHNHLPMSFNTDPEQPF